MKITPMIAVVGLAGLLLGVVDATAWAQVAAPRERHRTIRPRLDSTGSEVLKICRVYPFRKNNHPTHMIQIKLTGPFDVRNLNPEITEMEVNADPWTSGDPATSKPYDKTPTWTPRTRLDLDLDLAPVAEGKKREKVLIKIIVDDPTIKFRGDAFAITAADVNGPNMFCRFDGGYTDNSATFVAFYYKDPRGNMETFGDFNIGLVIPDADPNYMLPIFIDPEVKNNGLL